MDKKYELTEETLFFDGRVLYRIKALKDFGHVKEGDLGGWVASERNLSQEDTCWVYDEAKVFDYARVEDCAIVRDSAEIHHDAKVCGFAEVGDNVVICGDAIISNHKSYLVFKNIWSTGVNFIYTRSNRMWKDCSFYGTGEDLIAQAYEDSETSGRCYEKYVQLVKDLEDILDDTLYKWK